MNLLASLALLASQPLPVPLTCSKQPNRRFVKNKPMLVCGNTASMVGESWLVSVWVADVSG